MIALAVIASIAGGAWAARSSNWYEGSDFFCLWQGAQMLVGGADPYDEAAWAAETASHQRELGPISGGACPGRYGYPLWTAALMAPFGAMPLPSAATAWMAVSFLGAALGTALIHVATGAGARTAPLFFALVATSQPFWILVISGQITGLLLAFMGLSAWLLSRGREGPAGAALAGLLLKPQVGGILLPVVVLRQLGRRRPALLVGSAVAIGALLIVTVALRPGWILEWAGEVSGRRLNVVTLLPTAWGLSADLFGTPLIAPALIAVVVAVALVIGRARKFGPVAFSAASLALALFAVPYAWSYDFLVLALPWGVAIALADRLPPARRASLLALTAFVAALLPWSLYAFAFTRGQETLSAVVPVAAAMCVALAVAVQPPGTTIA